MLRCITAHHVAAFGDIPVGSLWADDSPYVIEPDNFVDAAKPLPKADVDDVAKPRPVKKSAAKFVKES